MPAHDKQLVQNNNHQRNIYPLKLKALSHLIHTKYVKGINTI